MASSDANQSMLVESYVVNLIEQIEKRFPLYKKNLKEYSDVNKIKKLWEEVCEAVVPDWGQLSPENKTKQGREVQNKWANLRTCFRQELNAQKNTKSGQAATKRRQYVYFQQLLLLLPCMENRKTESNLERDDSQESVDDEESGASRSTPIPKRKKTTKPPNTDVDQALIEALNNNKNDDEDTNFALSLVPSLQKLTDEEKLDAKIGILNVFKQIREARRFHGTSQSTSNYNMLQQPMSSFPVYHRGTQVWQQPRPIYRTTPCSTPSPNLPTVQNQQDRASPGLSNDTDQSQVCQQPRPIYRTTPCSTPAPNLSTVQNQEDRTSPGLSNDTVQSYLSNFSEDSELSEVFDL